jgi:polar amino acid transport system permease protein
MALDASLQKWRKMVKGPFFETPKERRAFVLVWGGAALFFLWYFNYGPRAEFEHQWRWYLIWDYRRFLLWGVGTTMYIFAWSLVISLVLGVFCGIGRTIEIRWIRTFSAIYVEIFRNIPLLVQMWWAYFGLQELVNAFVNFPFGTTILIPSTFACILALSLYTGAYMGEVVRSGIRSIPKGQWEAALSTGLSRYQVWRHVILPQALAIVIPPMSSQVVNIIKNSAVAMTIAITDLMFYSQKIEEETFAGFEAYSTGTGLFLLLTLITVGIIYGFQQYFGLKVRSST